MMDKNKFYELFSSKLDLDNKNWILMSKYACKSNFQVSVSGFREVDKDYLYYYYNNEIWEVNLLKKYPIISSVHTLKELFKIVLKEKSIIGSVTDDKTVLLSFSSKGTKMGQVVFDLQVFGTKLTTEQKSEDRVFKSVPIFKDATKSEFSFLDNMKHYLNLKNKEYQEFTPNGFTGKTKYGTLIDAKITKISNAKSLQQKEVVDLIGYLILVIKEKEWEDITKLM